MITTVEVVATMSIAGTVILTEGVTIVTTTATIITIIIVIINDNDARPLFTLGS
jgi:hypothetical protein